MVLEEISQSFFDLQNGSNYSLSYLLVKSEHSSGDNLALNTYGIAIKLLDNQNNLKDFSQIEDICTNKKEVIGLINKLSKGTVTPVSLKYHIEDYIAERSEI